MHARHVLHWSMWCSRVATFRLFVCLIRKVRAIWSRVKVGLLETSICRNLQSLFWNQSWPLILFEIFGYRLFYIFCANTRRKQMTLCLLRALKMDKCNNARLNVIVPVEKTIKPHRIKTAPTVNGRWFRETERRGFPKRITGSSYWLFQTMHVVITLSPLKLFNAHVI